RHRSPRSKQIPPSRARVPECVVRKPGGYRIALYQSPKCKLRRILGRRPAVARGALDVKEADEVFYKDGLRRERPMWTLSACLVDLPPLGDQPEEAAPNPSVVSTARWVRSCR